MKYTYQLDNLNCASCAAKIEENFKNNPTLYNVALDFSRGRLYVESDCDVDIRDIAATIDGIERGVVVTDASADRPLVEEASERGWLAFMMDGKWQLIRMLSAGILLVAGSYFQERPIAFVMLMAGYAIIAYDVILRSLNNILAGDVFDENFLMSVATLGAIAIGEFPEAVAVMLFYQVGEFFQNMAVDRSRRTIAEKMDLRVERVRVVEADQVVSRQPEAVGIGDLMLVGPGQKLALDGIVRRGESFVQTASITGEARPRRVTPGDAVLSGFINGDSELVVEATADYADSTVAKILELVERATSKKARLERFVTRFAKYYTPVVVLLAMLVALVPPLLLGANFTTWFYRGLIFLVISCPCALVISIPLSFFAGLGAAAKQGAVVKGGNYLEALSQLDTIIFDKTGTLTKGNFAIQRVVTAPGCTPEQLTRIAVTCEWRSQHPIARAIVAGSRHQALDITVDSFRETAGRGITLISGADCYLAGSASLMLENGIAVTDVATHQTVVHIAKNSTYLGAIYLADQLKDNATDAIDSLNNYHLALVSGDNQAVTQAVASELGIADIHADCLPEDKLNIVENHINQAGAGKVAFVGDGSNDAPVLAIADVGIAMGGVGTDAALEAADIMLMQDDVSVIPQVINISKKTMRIIVQNIVFALGFKLFVMILGVLGYANMWLAVFADVGVALLAVANALRILYAKNPQSQ